MSKRDISIVVDEGGAAGDGVGVKTAKGGPDGSPPLNALSPILAASAAGEAGLDDAQRRAKHRKDLLLDDDVLLTESFEGRAYVTVAVALYYGACLCTAGLFWLVMAWFPTARARLYSRHAPHREADFFIVTSADGGSTEICPVEAVDAVPRELRPGRRFWLALDSPLGWVLHPVSAPIPLGDRMVVYRHSRFCWAGASNSFELQVPEDFPPAAGGVAGGLTSQEAAARFSKNGPCVIDVPIPSDLRLFADVALSPFVVFQLWAVIVWCTEAYYGYSVFIFVTAVGTALVNFLDVRRNLRDIRRLSLYRCPVTVVRDGKPQVIDSSALVPGDIMHVERGMKLPCDAVLVGGVASVSEVMLTGEATVVTKTAGDLATSHTTVGAAHTLFGGTNVAELRVPAGQAVTATVVRTGWESVRGRLVLSILYPRPVPFKFMREAFYFIAILFAAAMVGFGINAWQLAISCVDPDTGLPRACTGEDIATIVQRGCDMVTIVVPPALPLALSVGVIYAMAALRNKKLYCISPSKVNVSGKINCVCYDKTGTLTTDGLQLSCVQPTTSTAASSVPAFAAPVTAPECATPVLDTGFRALLAACHGLTLVGGALAGDPLELQTFVATGAALDEPHVASGADLAPLQAATPSLSARVRLPVGGGKAASPVVGESGSVTAAAAGGVLHIVGTFDFVPRLQRMSTLVEDVSGVLGGGAGVTYAFVKGSPEAIASLCVPSSLPADFSEVVQGYTRRGFRVLGAGSKVYTGGLPLPGAGGADALRAGAESGLTFRGLIVLENPLKPQSAPTIARLRKEAAMPQFMVTGDHGVAAVAVARECGLVEPGYRVFLGDVAGGDTGGAKAGVHVGPADVEWRDVDEPGSRLDPATLLPVDGSSGTPYRLALTGRAFAVLLAHHRSGASASAAGAGFVDSDFLPRLLLNCAVLSRMSPDQKAQLVEELQAAGLYVLMIGDGANDALALRAAHVGISLSQVEASVAAPFTYAVENPSIEAVPMLLLEGRGALTTSFNLFLFMALYSTIQFANALLIIFAVSFLSNNMYLYQDLFTVFVLALTMGNTPAATKLTVKRPSGRLFSGQNLLLTIGFIAFTFGLQAHVFLLVRKQSWYGSLDYPEAMQYDDPYAIFYDYEGTNSAIPETTAVFLMSTVQYIAVASIFSIGWPFKLPSYHNPLFLIWLLFMSGCALALFFAPRDWVYWLLSMQMLPQSFLNELFGWSMLSFGLYFIFWGAIVAGRYAGFFRACNRLLCRKRDAQHKRLRAGWKAQFAGGFSRMSVAPSAAASPASSAATSPAHAAGRGQGASAKLVEPEVA